MIKVPQGFENKDNDTTKCLGSTVEPLKQSMVLENINAYRYQATKTASSKSTTAAIENKQLMFFATRNTSDLLIF